MSNHTERSEWSPDEIDSLENIDKEIQLVSSSSDSYSTPNQKKNKGTLNDKVELDCNLKIQTLDGPHQNKNSTYLHSRQSNNSKGLNLKLHSSCDDLSLWSGNKLEPDLNDIKCNHTVNCSNNSINLKSNKKTNINKYGHIESKIKPYFNNNSNSKTEATSNKQKNSVISEVKENVNKEEYLQEINKQLTKELDEKNTILTLLQESYEHLLFKYAEAQNRIDELRFKFMSEANESRTCLHDKKFNQIDNNLSSHFHYDEEYIDKSSNMKFPKEIITPFIKSEETFYGAANANPELPVNKPSTLPLYKFLDRDIIKATTPTDSEGLSSLITSMSGHSKILDSLDEENQGNKKSSFAKFQSGNYILEETSCLNDPFDKVKHWQNSLPPLEQIETPETTLYNVLGNKIEVFIPADTKYKNLSSSKADNDYNFLNESCPSSWLEDKEIGFHKKKFYSYDIEEYHKISHRTSSLPNTFKKRTTGSEFFSKKTHHSLELLAPKNNHFSDHFAEKIKHNKNDNPPLFVSYQNKKGPSLVRCSSLPSYDYYGLNSGNYKNGIYIPPLNLGNIALSDDDSSTPYNHFSKNIAPTPTSFISNRSMFVDRSKQTSFSSCKATITKENTFSRISKPNFNKSASIASDTDRAINSHKSENWCSVCGATMSENKSLQFFLNRSNSYESIDKNKNSNKESEARTKPPFTRSASFNSEANSPKNCSRDEKISGNFVSGSSQDSLENFEMYARNLKARSRVVIEALTAHVNNS